MLVQFGRHLISSACENERARVAAWLKNFSPWRLDMIARVEPIILAAPLPAAEMAISEFAT